MMKNLLEIYFGKHYNSTKVATVTYQLAKGKCTYTDLKACADCKRLTPDVATNCDKTVLICDFGVENVESIELEKFIENYSNLKKIPSSKHCDLLFVGGKKIVFCDMTCSKAKYINPFTMKDGSMKIGKRNTVRGQIENSISLLTDVPEIEISTKDDKIALFAYREKQEINKVSFDASVKDKMNTFSNLSTNIFKEPMFSDMGNGFLFTEVKYPNVCKW